VPNPKTGKNLKLDKIVSNLASAKEAHDKRAELLAGLEQRQPADATERKTVGSYATLWLRSKLRTLKASTRSLYATVLDEHVVPDLGDYFLDQIERDDLISWRAAQLHKPLLDSKGRARMHADGTPILPDVVTVNGRFRILKSMIAEAVVTECLPRDPTLRIDKLRETFDAEAVVDDDDGKSITATELAALLEAAREHVPHWHPFFYMLAFTGLRFGEITALKWRDLDEGAGKIWIRRAQWKGIVDTVKGDKPRTVPLMPELAAVLATHREAQRAAFTKRAKRRQIPDLTAFATGDWVFPSRQVQEVEGAPLALKLMHSTAPRKPLALALAKAGLEPGFTTHGFRHTFNNLVRNVAELNGQNIVLQAMTGHSSDEMTEHYSQVSIEEKRRAVGGLLRLVHGQSL
jgi:integrase